MFCGEIWFPLVAAVRFTLHGPKYISLSCPHIPISPRYDEAAQLYQATIDGLALNNIPRNSRKITELFLKMGQIYAIVSDYTQAELSFL